MAVSPSAPGLPAVLAALAGTETPAALNSGDVIAARVSAQLSGDLARLLFRGGAIDVRLPTPLPAGSEVVFQVQKGGYFFRDQVIFIYAERCPGIFRSGRERRQSSFRFFSCF